MIEEVLRRTQVCIPFRLLKAEYLPLVLEKGINPEIGIDGDVLDAHSRAVFVEMADSLNQAGLSITLHGPFFDLVPGGMDKKLLACTRERLKEAFDLIPVFDPLSIVCHTGYDRKRYGDSRDEWLETALETWTALLRDLQGTKTTLMIENVYEKTPLMLLKLFKGLNSDRVGFCFDAGHMNAFSETDMAGWLGELGPFIKQLHLHDNRGDDDHLAIGAGEIDFESLFAYLEQKGLTPIMTLEAHKKDWIWQSLQALSRSSRFRRIVGL